MHITRMVMKTKSTQLFLVTYDFGPEVTPGLASRLADMTKWDTEVKMGHHRVKIGNKVSTPKCYTKGDYARVYELFEVRVPTDAELDKLERERNAKAQEAAWQQATGKAKKAKKQKASV